MLNKNLYENDGIKLDNISKNLNIFFKGILTNITGNYSYCSKFIDINFMGTLKDGTSRLSSNNEN